MATLVVKLKKREIQRVPVIKKKVTIGRAPECDVVIDNVGISRVHATVEAKRDYFLVSDAGSVNGMSINGQRLDRHILEDGDELQLGKFVVYFTEVGGLPIEELGGSEESVPAIHEHSERTYALTADEVQRVVAAVEQAQAPSAQPPKQAGAFAQPGKQHRRSRRLKIILVSVLIVLLAGAGVLVFFLTRSS